MPGIASNIYKQVPHGRSIFRRNQVFLAAIFTGAFAFEIAFDTTSTKVWDTLNKGRQWKDIKQRYMQQGGDEDEE